MRPGLLLLPVLVALPACSRDPAPLPAPVVAAPIDAGDDAEAPLARLVDPGRDPRIPMSFAFVKDRTEKAELTIDSHMVDGDKKLGEEHVVLRLDVRYLASDTVEMTLRHAETTANMPSIVTTIGGKLTQKFRPSGETEMPTIAFPTTAEDHAADYVRGALIQIAACFLPPMPAEPIGEGARWVRTNMRFALLKRRPKLLVVERHSGMEGTTKLDTGETIHASEEQNYRIEAPPDGIARHVEAELVSKKPVGVMTTRLRFDVTAGAP